MLMLQLYALLKKHTDVEHRVTVQRLMRLLREEYDIEVDRRTVRDNLMKMQEFGIPVAFGERIRYTGNQAQTVISNWYLEPEFDNMELNYLIDGLLFSKNIPRNQLQDLIRKIEGLGHRKFSSAYEKLEAVDPGVDPNPEFFLNLEILSEAIEMRRKVAFQYLEYGANRKKRPRKKSDGSVREYRMNPYRVVAANGWYYLICNHENYDGISQYRVDRMKDIRILDETARPIRQIEGYKEGLKLPVHMAEHIYMFGGESVECVFRAKETDMQQIVDWFGKKIKVKKEGDEVYVTVKVNEKAMFHWALQYGPNVTVLAPESLVHKLRETLDEMQARYRSDILPESLTNRG